MNMPKTVSKFVMPLDSEELEKITDKLFDVLFN